MDSAGRAPAGRSLPPDSYRTLPDSIRTPAGLDRPTPRAARLRPYGSTPRVALWYDAPPNFLQFYVDKSIPPW